VFSILIYIAMHIIIGSLVEELDDFIRVEARVFGSGEKYPLKIV
jgi:hypothetical protein